MKFEVIEKKEQTKENETISMFRAAIDDVYCVTSVLTIGGDYAWRNVTINVNENYKYVPQIVYNDDFDRKLNPSREMFQIQTSAYGAMNPDEIQKVMEGYQMALEAVKVLSEVFGE